MQCVLDSKGHHLGVEFWEAVFERDWASVFEEAVRTGAGTHWTTIHCHVVGKHYLERRGPGNRDGHLNDILEGGRVLVATFHRHYGDTTPSASMRSKPKPNWSIQSTRASSMKRM